MKRPSRKERFLYWFDNQMARGSLSLIRLLVIATILIILLLAFIISAFDAEVGLFDAIWETMVTVINAWMPSAGDGSRLYIVFMAVAAVSGLLITSVLIGIVSSAIEEKITSLRKGNSAVLEEDHIVVLGFYPGEYTLLRQLILAAAGQSCTIVVADDVERDEMEESIRDNIEIPANIRIICRTVDIFDPATLEKLSLETCRTIIIAPTDDIRTMKALLAVSTIIDSSTNDKVRIGAIVSRDEYRFPPTLASRHNVTTLQTNDTIAKIIAHSCTQPGLSEVFREVFNFEGSELYTISLPGTEGMKFEQLLLQMDRALPAGISSHGKITLNPDPDTVINEGDQLLVFAEERNAAVLLKEPVEVAALPADRMMDEAEEDAGMVLIIGANASLDTILQELPENVTDVIMAETGAYSRDVIREIANDRDITVTFSEADLNKEMALADLARQADHVVLLCDHEGDEEEADMRTIFRLLNLRDVRTRYSLAFNITAEMRREQNQNLVVSDDHTDFVVSSNMSSLFLAQLAESPELAGVFDEILSNRGNELYLKNAGTLFCTGERTVAELRMTALRQNYIMLGYIKDGESVFNPGLHDSVYLGLEDSVIVLGEN